jgi:hypothetical protein
MPFEPGQSGNPTGRPKGSANKASRQLKEMIANFLVEHFEEVEQCFKELKGKEKIKTYCEMLSFIMPKLKPLNDDMLDRLDEVELEDLFERLKNESTKTIQNSKGET